MIAKPPLRPSLLSGLLAAPLLAMVFWLAPAPAHAQYGMQPGGMMPGMPPPQKPGGRDDTEEGPAEKAPDDDDSEASQDDPIGPYHEDRRRTQVIELDGYLRLRTDWLHGLALGQGYVDEINPRTPPFPTAIECGMHTRGCGAKSLGSANLRLRLEPIINISDQVRVMTQVDVLDNTIMGSTPDSLATANRLTLGTGYATHPILSNSQDPPEVGRNGTFSSLRAKRAWGEVDSEFGSLRFGRMPWHWGRGMFFNNGACADCDGGTSVDRLMALSQLYGHQVALAWDFGSQGTNLAMTELGIRDPEAPPLDLSQTDDVFQLMGSIAKLDDEETFRGKAARGDLALNYGFQLVYRDQSRTLYPSANESDNVVPDGQTTFSREDLSAQLQKSDAVVFIPDLWFKLGWKALTIEFEGAAVLGKIGNGGPLAAEGDRNKKLDLRQYGWVLSSDLSLFKNAFFVGLETGGASGDQAENPRGYLNYRWNNVQQPVGDHAITNFKFSPDYHVDQILFRRLYGTVSNAVYVKPKLAYWLNLAESRQVGVNAAFLYSMAQVPVATPGNELNYGLEMNLGLTYRNPADGFYAGIVWAVMWPLAALDRPGAKGGDDALWPSNQDAASAQVLRTFFGIRF